MFKVAGGIILAIIVLGVGVPVMCGVCVVGSAALDKHSKTVEKEEAAKASPTGETVVYRDACRLRSEPSASSSKIGTAAAGEVYSVLETRGRWRQIMVGSTVGWAGCLDTQ